VFPDRLRHNPNFVDIDETHAAKKPGNGVVYFGRLSNEKGVDVLIDAVASLGEPLRIAGAGPAERELRDRAAKAGAHVEFLGRLPREELHDVVRASRATVLPARWFENQPLSVLESYACGVPVVASNLGGLPEIVRNGETGALVPHNDPDALAGALSRYIDDEALAYHHGRAGRALVEGVHSPEAHVERLFHLYEEAGQLRDRSATSG
jgi:glycosyltransferase involved in cell wall biosynthesis